MVSGPVFNEILVSCPLRLSRGGGRGGVRGGGRCPEGSGKGRGDAVLTE